METRHYKIQRVVTSTNDDFNTIYFQLVRIDDVAILYSNSEIQNVVDFFYREINDREVIRILDEGVSTIDLTTHSILYYKTIK